MLATGFTWFHLWLILHILAAIIAFGPSFSYGLIISLARKKPQHFAFAAEVIEMIERRVSLPLAAIIPFLGVALIYTGHIDLWKSEWPFASIILYIGAFFFALLVQTPTTGKLVRLLTGMEGPPPPGAGPPPEVQALGKRLQLGGAYLGASVVAILVLMVWRPGA